MNLASQNNPAQQAIRTLLQRMVVSMVAAIAAVTPATASDRFTELPQSAQQGAMVIGRTASGNRVKLEGQIGRAHV